MRTRLSAKYSASQNERVEAAPRCRGATSAERSLRELDGEIVGSGRSSSGDEGSGEAGNVSAEEEDLVILAQEAD